MQTFYESLTPESRKLFKNLAINTIGPDWKPVLSKNESKLETQEEIEKIMQMTPGEFNHIEEDV